MRDIRQGDIWQVRTITGEAVRTVAVLDSDAVVKLRPAVVVAPVLPQREVPNGVRLLAVPLAGDPAETVAVYSLSTVLKERFAQRVGAASAEEWDLIKNALAARFDL
ncbi:MAG: hypothetical protein HOQ24_17465 [Mycobacteriaceae bacterium]|nr:hypothetical protein [Mycobacteriaceae bacterium]